MTFPVADADADNNAVDDDDVADDDDDDGAAATVASQQTFGKTTTTPFFVPLPVSSSSGKLSMPMFFPLSVPRRAEIVIVRIGI